MAWRDLGGVSMWRRREGAAQTLAAAAAWTCVAAILAFYVVRLAVPLPLFAADAGAYLIRALYPDPVAARNPVVTAITNGVHLSLIRGAWRLGALTGWPYIVVDQVVNAALCLAGLVAFWRESVRGLGRRERQTLLILALGFAYYRFTFSNLAEGPFVALLALVCVITRRWWRGRPRLHALLAGLACAALVLSKPHGVAAVAALGAVALVDAVAERDGRRLALRVALFVPTFLVAGNLIQIAAEEPVTNRIAFWMSGFYESALGAGAPAGAGLLGLQAFWIMAAGALLLAGTPALIGLAELAGRWRAERGAFRLQSRDAVFLMLLAALGATLVMASIFEMKIASTPSETRRLWGRYFEFYAPLIWLAAAPALARPIGRGLALACGGVTLVALAGLLGMLQRGWIVMPWDSAVLTAFFAPDPVRAAVNFPVPYRALAAGAGLLACAAYALRARPAAVGAALLLALSLLSTWLDQAWLGGLVRERYVLDHELKAIRPALPAEPARVVLLTPDANVGHLAFLQLKAQPFVVLGEPSDPPPGALDGAAAVVATGEAAPPGAWSLAYRGKLLSLWKAQALPNPP